MSLMDDDVAEGLEDVLSEIGTACVYIRAAATSSITLSKRLQPTQQVQTTTGHIVEITPVDFVGLTNDFPYDPPLKGDRIKIGSEIYEVQPTLSNAVYQRLTPKVTRVHTKRIS